MTIIEEVESMSRNDLASVWFALSQQRWSSNDTYDAERGITMDDWANAVYGEMCHRQIPRSYIEPIM